MHYIPAPGLTYILLGSYPLALIFLSEHRMRITSAVFRRLRSHNRRDDSDHRGGYCSSLLRAGSAQREGSAIGTLKMLNLAFMEYSTTFGQFLRR